MEENKSFLYCWWVKLFHLLHDVKDQDMICQMKFLLRAYFHSEKIYKVWKSNRKMLEKFQIPNPEKHNRNFPSKFTTCMTDLYFIYFFLVKNIMQRFFTIHIFGGIQMFSFLGVVHKLYDFFLFWREFCFLISLNSNLFMKFGNLIKIFQFS